MKKEEIGFNFKKFLFLIGIILILVIVGLYWKKDYCEHAKYTIVDTSSITLTNNLEDWLNSFGG